MPRFYFPQSCRPGSETDLPDHIVRHMQVLRLRHGTVFTLFDGEGNEYAAELTELGRRHARCRIGGAVSGNRESPLEVTLVQAVSGSSHMDFTLQKSVELGVAAIRPVFSERSARIDGERAGKRLHRWQEIVIAACEQSGRNHIPPVLPSLPFADYLAQKSTDPHWILSLNQPQRLTDIAAAPAKLHLLVGAEGGWTAAEEQQAADAGCRAVGLGPRVLRTETAALAALTAVQVLWGDMG